MGPLIRVRYGETVQRTRVARSGEADSKSSPVPIKRTAFGRAQSVVINDDQRGRRTVIERNWFCPRGADVRQGDRIERTNGEVYSVISPPLGDVNHPLSGHNLGVKKHRVRTVSTPHG